MTSAAVWLPPDLMLCRFEQCYFSLDLALSMRLCLLRIYIHYLLLRVRLEPRCVFFFFFFFHAFFPTSSTVYVRYINSNCNFWPVFCEQYICALFTEQQISFFIKFFIKNRSYSTIHTFKNYFITVFSVFSFNKISSIKISLLPELHELVL